MSKEQKIRDEINGYFDKWSSMSAYSRFSNVKSAVDMHNELSEEVESINVAIEDVRNTGKNIAFKEYCCTYLSNDDIIELLENRKKSLSSGMDHIKNVLTNILG